MKQSQTNLLLKHLREGKTITALEALELFGCMNLKGRIWDAKQLLDKDEEIRMDLIETPTGKHIGLYKLINNNKQTTLFEGAA